jgi:hypothetical protein
MNHRAICYDDEGQLVCSCPIGAAEGVARDEKISRAEAEQLVNDYALEMTAAVLNVIR